jgi:hypothetical protein
MDNEIQRKKSQAIRPSRLQPRTSGVMNIDLRTSEKLCGNCNDTILSSNFYKIDDEEVFYHMEHLLCKVCDKDLSQIGYYYHEEGLYCEHCFSELYLPHCVVCNKGIQNEFVSCEDLNFHKKCFRCSKCSGRLDETFYLKNSTYYCNGCAKKELDSCFVCKLGIVDEKYETVDGISFHKDCLKCAMCSESLTDDSFIPYNNQAYHISCYKSNVGIKCFVCATPIDGQYYSHMNKNLHFECIDKVRRISTGFARHI